MKKIIIMLGFAVLAYTGASAQANNNYGTVPNTSLYNGNNLNSNNLNNTTSPTPGTINNAQPGSIPSSNNTYNSPYQNLNNNLNNNINNINTPTPNVTPTNPATSFPSNTSPLTPNTNSPINNTPTPH